MEKELEELENQYEKEKIKLAEKRKELEQASEKLNEISTNEKCRLILQHKKLQEMYNKEKETHHQLKSQWAAHREAMLKTCSGFYEAGNGAAADKGASV